MSRPTRIPGFADPGHAASPRKDGADVWTERGARQVNLRLRIQLHRRYRSLLRTLEAEGFETSLTEIVHALLLSGPKDAEDAKALVRVWRRTIER